MKLIATSLKCAKWVSTGVGEGHAIGGVGERWGGGEGGVVVAETDGEMMQTDRGISRNPQIQNADIFSKVDTQERVS